MTEVERSMILFQEGIASKETLESYRWELENFRKYYKLKNAALMLTMEPKKLQIMIEDYVFHLKKTVNPNTVSTYMKSYPKFHNTCADSVIVSRYRLFQNG